MLTGLERRNRAAERSEPVVPGSKRENSCREGLAVALKSNREGPNGSFWIGNSFCEPVNGSFLGVAITDLGSGLVFLYGKSAVF